MTKEFTLQHLRSLNKISTSITLIFDTWSAGDHYLNMTDPSSFSFMDSFSHEVVVSAFSDISIMRYPDRYYKPNENPILTLTLKPGLNPQTGL